MSARDEPAMAAPRNDSTWPLNAPPQNGSGCPSVIWLPKRGASTLAHISLGKEGAHSY